MKQINLIHKLKELQAIKPSNEFAAVSKLIILNGEHQTSNAALAKKLGHLKRLTPTAHFSAISRELILNKETKRAIPVNALFKKSFNYSLAMGVMVIFMALITSVGYLEFLSPIPRDIYGKNITDASDAIKEIDIHLKEAEYLAAADKKTSLALHEASITTIIDHTSPMLIEHEGDETNNFKDPRNKSIDELLNEATL